MRIKTSRRRKYFPLDYAQKYVKEMSEEELCDFYKRVRLYVYRKFGRLSKDTGLDLDEVIQAAIETALSGKRQWPVKNVDFPIFIYQIVRSKISHIGDQEKKKLPIDETSEKSESQHSFPKELSVSEDYEGEIHYSELCEMLRARVQSDPDLKAMVELLIENQFDMKPEEIARILGWDVKKVYNDRKRLCRIAQALIEELRHGNQ